ncbi:uncharacterized protein LOC143430015 [Xylocopa sonorina]|uniref:uncharacterized protein LOC143430015 n=1 Tax=Xylocopa sonorina TaxID=1818115 RepID=UPI00403A8C45
MSPSVKPLPVEKLDMLLAESLDNDLQIKHVEWKPLTAPGENYGSVMLAITVTLTRSKNKTETLHLVAKLPPRTAYQLDLFNSPVTFKKEIHFYNAMAKELVNLQLECGIKQEDLSILVPKYYGGRLGLKTPEVFDENAVIVMENIKVIGYDTGDRVHGLDEKHARFTIDKLAKLHALVIAFKLKKPQAYQRIAEIVMAQVANETTEKCIGDMIQKTIADIKGIEELKPYVDRVIKAFEYCERANKNPGVVEEPWGTLIHNDYWVNNMMFQHDARGEVTDMKIVDFQLCAYDYGVKDLLFLLMSSLKKDLLDNKLNDLIDLYYACFVKMLTALKVDTEKFSKRRFDEILNECGPVKFTQSIMMTQVIQAPPGSAPDVADLKNGSIFGGTISDETYKQKLIQIVNIYDKRGWLGK